MSDTTKSAAEQSTPTFVDLSTVAAQKEQWIKAAEQLQAHIQKLEAELTQARQNLLALGGAIQACSVFEGKETSQQQ